MFNVELSTPESAGRGVVALRRELDVAHAPGVASHLTTAVTVYGSWVVVDMTGLEYIGSAGLGMLVRVLRRTGQKAVTCRWPPRMVCCARFWPSPA